MAILSGTHFDYANLQGILDDDQISGLEGNDNLFGLAGNAALLGGLGNTDSQLTSVSSVNVTDNAVNDAPLVAGYLDRKGPARRSSPWQSFANTIFAVIAMNCIANARAEPLQVVAFVPAPNYARTTDPGDAAQLTDGIAVPRRIWTSTAGVGWSRTSPVIIHLRRVNANPARYVSGKISIHTARRTRSGVQIPTRVDIYTVTATGTLVYGGGAKFDPTSFADNSDHWIDVPVNAARADIYLVVHGTGDYIFTDEISWPGVATTVRAPVASTFGTLALAKADSVARLQTASATYRVEPVQALAFSPAPNYPLTSDESDLVQVTDRVTVPGAIWKSILGVGWARSSQVVVRLQRNVSGNSNYTRGRVSIHTSRRDLSEVQVPQRVDVYTTTPTGAYVYAGGKQFDPASFANESNHWLDVPVDAVRNELILVIHAHGEFIFTDEITLSTDGTTVAAPAGNRFLTIAETSADSVTRLRNAFAGQTIVASSSALAAAVGPAGLVAWVVKNPWEDLPLAPDATTIVAGRDLPLSIIGARNEQEAAAIGLLNTSNAARKVSITLPQDWVAKMRVAKLKRVLAADGKWVFDAIQPLAAASLNVDIPAQSTAYLWLNFTLPSFAVGRSATNLILSEPTAQFTQSIPMEVNVNSTFLNVGAARAINWGYDRDSPIWAHPAQARDDLIAHGINVFVVHTSDIPQPDVTGGWSAARETRLKAQLAQWRGKGTVLLFLDWFPSNLDGFGLSWLNTSSPAGITARRAALASWLPRIKAVMTAAGFTAQQWALYPIDELAGRDLPFLTPILAELKSIDLGVRIYVNPMDSSSAPTDPNDLIPLKPYVDIWQPQLAFAEGRGRTFFTTLGKEWWAFGNAISPSKSASPLRQYRFLAWRAYALGANGVGFWSYSDTNGTSAWDDLDGRYPDRAVIYEGATLISSRRWEAFREGMEDLALFRVMANDPSKLVSRDLIEAAVKGTPDQWENLRRQLLQ